jgi:protein TonB
MRFDMTNTTSGGTSGVSVETGEGGGVPGGETGGTGKKAGGKGTAPAEQASGTGTTWEPRSDIFIKDLPDPVSVPKLTCPATRDQGVSGTVVLKVQVQRDGKVRKVTVAKGIGGGCDQIAAKALRQARFKAAMGTNGKPVDYELRYEYEFRLSE